MTDFKRISVEEAKTLLDKGNVAIVDIRDSQSYESSHIDGATFLDNNAVKSFIENTSMDTPVLVYCYHGNSSQGAANFLTEQGFKEVYSMDGGFEQWRSTFNN